MSRIRRLLTTMDDCLVQCTRRLSRSREEWRHLRWRHAGVSRAIGLILIAIATVVIVVSGLRFEAISGLTAAQHLNQVSFRAAAVVAAVFGIVFFAILVFERQRSIGIISAYSMVEAALAALAVFPPVWAMTTPGATVPFDRGNQVLLGAVVAVMALRLLFPPQIVNAGHAAHATGVAVASRADH